MKTLLTSHVVALWLLGLILMIGCDRIGDPIAPEGKPTDTAKSSTHAGASSINKANSLPFADGLVSWWPANGNAHDIVGGNHGTLVNGATFAKGVVGQAFSFDGIDDYIDAGADTSFNITNAITLVAFIKLGSTGRDQKVTSYFLPYEMGICNDKIEFLPGSAGFVSVVHRNAPGGTVLKRDRWYHVATTWDGSTITSYVNGHIDRTASYSNTLDTGTNNLNIGRAANGGFHLDGLIDEVAIWNRALTASQIEKLFLFLRKKGRRND